MYNLQQSGILLSAPPKRPKQTKLPLHPTTQHYGYTQTLAANTTVDDHDAGKKAR